TLFLIIEPPKQFNWKLTNETKIILGYTCYKATHNREGGNPVIVTAWYCPEIPYQFGPKGYAGLPGLILEIVLGGKTTFTADTINWDDDVWVIKPIHGKKITREALNAMYNTAIEEMKSYDKN
ncbi:MAG: GLPGLI family protein, partial [Bacteroidetes bacterium]